MSCTTASLLGASAVDAPSSPGRTDRGCAQPQVQQRPQMRRSPGPGERKRRIWRRPAVSFLVLAMSSFLSSGAGAAESSGVEAADRATQNAPLGHFYHVSTTTESLLRKKLLKGPLEYF